MRITPRGLRKFDHLPPVEAVIAAWTETLPQNTRWTTMPLLERS